MDAPSIVPFDKQTVNATIHHFPSLEPLRFESYPANHLYLPTRRDILHRAVIFEGDATRRGTASTKWRSEIRGSARKIRPQKGSGRARLGDKKSPMLKGGGVAFGPKPRDFSTGLNKKIYDLAWRTALSYRFRKGELVIVNNALELESSSTTLLKSIFQRHGWGQKKGRSLLVTTQDRPLLQMALTEQPKEGRTKTWDDVDVKDLLEMGRIVIERKALSNILMTHSSDLPPPSIRRRPFSELEPHDLQAIPGWSEFRDLELASPEFREEHKSQLYEQAAEKRLAWAQEFSGAQREQVMVSALELKAEGKLLAAQRVESDPIMRHFNNDEVDHPEAHELHVKATEKKIEALELWAEHAELKAEIERLQGINNETDEDEWGVMAEDHRAEAEELRQELNGVPLEEGALEEYVDIPERR